MNPTVFAVMGDPIQSTVIISQGLSVQFVFTLKFEQPLTAFVQEIFIISFREFYKDMQVRLHLRLVRVAKYSCNAYSTRR